MRWQKSGSFGFAKGRLCVSGQNQMCHLCGWLKLFLKKCGGGKNKKHRVGNECRLTRCPFVKSFLCLWSPVKMVYFFLVFSPLFDVCTVVLPLAITIRGLKQCSAFGEVKDNEGAQQNKLFPSSRLRAN